jgi:hypothetical protein
MKSMNTKLTATLNAKYAPVKKNKVVSVLESLAGMGLMSFFPIMAVYSFVQICLGNG